MNFLKSLLVSLLTLILFLSLTMFGTVFTLKSTLLDPDFVVKQVDRLEVSELVAEMTRAQIGGQLPTEMAFLEEAMFQAIEENEPWLKEQVNSGVYAFYDFMLGESDRLSLVISLDRLKNNLRDTAWRTFAEEIPPELSLLPPDQVEQYFNEYYRQIDDMIPSQFEVDESLIPGEVMATLLQAKQYVSYVQTAYIGLIILMLVLILAIIFLSRNVKDATRGLGITFLFSGVTQYLILWATSRYSPALLPFADVPPSLQTWLLQLTDDLMAPLQTLSIGVMAVGAALIIVSFVYRRRREGEPAGEEIEE